MANLDTTYKLVPTEKVKALAYERVDGFMDVAIFNHGLFTVCPRKAVQTYASSSVEGAIRMAFLGRIAVGGCSLSLVYRGSVHKGKNTSFLFSTLTLAEAEALAYDVGRVPDIVPRTGIVPYLVDSLEWAIVQVPIPLDAPQLRVTKLGGTMLKHWRML